MNILILTDELNGSTAMLDFISHFGFPDVHVRFLHAVRPMISGDSSLLGMAAINDAELIEFERRTASEMLQRACDTAEKAGFQASWKVDYGYPGPIVGTHASEFGADLVALAAAPTGRMDRALSGDVARRIVADHGRDVLVVRNDQHLCEGLSVVYATDHSASGDKCLDRLLEWNPTGINHAQVLTAYEALREVAVAGDTEILTEDEVASLIRKSTLETTEKVSQRFRDAGIPSAAVVIAERIEDAIQTTMSSTQADLLVLDSHSHGFWQKLVGNTTSLHELATGQYSLLILRAEAIPAVAVA